MTPRKVYFLGIGGIGMSALARYYRLLGAEVHGYDRTRTTLTEQLEAEGMIVHYDENPNRIPDGVDLFVYTPAVPETNKEMQYLREQGIELKKRAEVLGLISRDKRVLAVAGTHGKTTTTSILTHLLRTGGVAATAFLGGLAKNYEGNFVFGESDYVVVEADEYDRSFLHLYPERAAIMSIDPDHLDIYGDPERMFEEGFQRFAQQVNSEIFLPENLVQSFENQTFTSFGIETGICRATRVRVEDGRFRFDYQNEDLKIEDLRSALPGRHNILNAVAAISLALSCGVRPESIREGMQSFRGIVRRFERLYDGMNGVYIDDYAHHPTELNAAIGAARELFPGQKITGIFQPHLYSRTRDFQDGFAAALDRLDTAVLLPIYPARELPMEGVSTEMIFEKMKGKDRHLLEPEAVVEFLESRKPTVVLTLGAGDIDLLREPVRRWMERGAGAGAGLAD